MASRKITPTWIYLAVGFIAFLVWLAISYFAGWPLPSQPFGSPK